MRQRCQMRRLQVQRLIKGQVIRSTAEVLHPAHHVSDTHRGVVHNVSKVISRVAVFLD